MAGLETDVRYIKGVGEKKAESLNKLGIGTLRELVSYFPRDYEDRSAIRPIAECLPEETACVVAVVAAAPRLSRIRKGMELLKLRIVDDTGSIEVTFFNQSYYKSKLLAGESYAFYGRLGGTRNRLTLTNPVFEPESELGRVTGRIVPIYRLRAGISQNLLSRAVRQGLDSCGPLLPEYLPESVRREYQLAGAEYAYESIHFPADYTALALARRRLIFEELFLLACALGRLRGARERERGQRFETADAGIFYESLPFEPTGAQKRAVAESFADLCSGYPMNRLIQGDVGSGKTLIAAACLWLARENGRQSAFMAPTEILARQHLKTLSGFLEPLGMRVGLLTGAMGAAEKRRVKAELLSGELDVIIGTHALLTGDVEFAKLGLVITDEQHRFGVDQRGSLVAKGDRPHVLVMSATPIPRTLALIIYSDLDVSVIDEMPPGRQPIDTFTVSTALRPRIYRFIQKLADEGRQVYVVCPMVEENEELELKSAEEYARELEQVFPRLRIGCVHGRLKAKDKDRIMTAFSEGELDILVSTTVIEVGVDVPNAALMLVENAERFGLSQLHQLRGRVGRGEHKSYCVLVSDAKNDESRARLRAMKDTNDGFKIAQEDLRLRGPGDFFGSRQHGLPELHIADLCLDMDVLQQASDAARELLAQNPELAGDECGELREQIKRVFELRDGVFN